ncbi:Putative DNA helicase ino80 [Epichloe bromicola]
MDPSSSRPGSPAGGPLQAVTPERANRRDAIFSSLRGESKDGSVHEKINQFNNLSIAMQSKQMERKTADAALKRAMLGREEAEADLKRLRDEARLLRGEIEQGRERERKVGERLEAVMDNYGRAKETHAHTQALWEKEIRRARKENFKSQSAIVKLQEELKSARNATKSVEESLQREKERSKVREQEAFTARYQIVGVQEQLDKALERIKLVEQERDAFKTAAKNEEVARIAAEGRLPLPASHDLTDEFASPKKKKVAPARRQSGRNAPRVSLSTMEIMSSAASEMEIEELGTQVLWERQRADRAQEMIEFLQAECQMRLCSCSKTSNSRKSADAPQKRRRVSTEQEQQEDVVVKEETASPHPHSHSQRAASQTSLRSSHGFNRPSPHHEEERQPQPEPVPEPKPEVEVEVEFEVEQEPEMEPEPPQRVKSRKEPRRSTIFFPKEGIFRTVSEQEAAALEVQAQQTAVVNVEPATHEDADDAEQVLPTTEADPSAGAGAGPRMYARTPSVDPPAFALLGEERNSLDFLLDVAHDEAQSAPPCLPSLATIPTVADAEAAGKSTTQQEAAQQSFSPAGSPQPRAHSTSTASFTVTTTVPLREDTGRRSSTFNERLRTPSHGSSASFDARDPAMTPTMTREQALAKIRERRGRARSAAQGATASSGNKDAASATWGPRGRSTKRDVSAPTAKATPKFK